jgi:mono/diheme cytochrome c family protein
LKPQEQFPAKSLSSKADSFNTDESLLSLLKSNEIYYASLQPHIYPRESTKETQQELNVADVFDIVDTQDESNPKNYYIKRIYYTPYNIQEGQKYFLLNCAVCHGNEADGSGIRGQAMQDAKPRMLTNLDWIQSRDDLRLIRSIKYGIPGTSMTPWGDYTNSLQRMQLVMFIRTLSQEREKRIQLDQTLYQTFDTAQVLVEEARIMGNQKLKELVLKEQQLSQHQKNLVKAVRENGEASEKALNMYQERLNLEQEIKTIKGKDQLLVDLKLLIKQERDLYFNLGVVLMTKDVNENILNQYHQLIRLQSNLYEWKQQRLFFQDIKGIKQKSLEIREEIEKQLDEKIIELEKKSQILKGKIASAQQKEDVATNQSDLEAFKMLKVKLVMDTEEALRLINKQNEIVEKLNDQK